MNPSQPRRRKHPQLFRLADPLTAHFGPDFFRQLPAAPGVYFFHNAAGDLLYIGQSVNLRTRISSYRHVADETHPRRTLRLVRRVHRIEWQVCADASAALVLEKALLLEHRPSFNRAGVWKGPTWWLNLRVDDDGRLELALNQDRQGIGPLSGAFRHVLGSVVRCLLRAHLPTWRMTDFPHGLFQSPLPAHFSFRCPEAERMAALIHDFAEGDAAGVLACCPISTERSQTSEDLFWSEEWERVKKHAEKLSSCPAPANSRNLNLQASSLERIADQ